MEESTLIIWEEIPENTRFFLVPNTTIRDTPSLLKTITSANGCLINAAGTDKALKLQRWLFNEDGDCTQPELEVKSEKGKLVFDKVLITKVCHTGFVL